LLAGVERREARPRAVVGGADEGEPHADAVLALGVALEGGDDAHLEALRRRDEPRGGASADSVGPREQLRIETELRIRPPVPLAHRVAHAGDEELPREAGADPVHLEDVAGDDAGESLERGAAANARQAFLRQASAGPRRKLRLAEGAAVGDDA